ncbi:NADP-dependent oxidoreductase [Parasphingopyxis sp.]|uniref:MDR family NADP-dependent oxidoreductase n=1 Tax=Parasphingopyxis sp. TaxID=1920299 RepID=UPI0032EED14A
MVSKILSANVTLENFALREAAVPTATTGAIVVCNYCFTVDPAIAQRLTHGGDYLTPLGKDVLIPSFNVGHVVETGSPNFAVGDIIVYYGGWEQFSLLDTAEHGSDPFLFRKIESEGIPLSYHLGVLGNKGFSAFLGIEYLGGVKSGETVVVSSAAGAVGSFAGQWARQLGARVIGLTGTSDKIQFLRSEVQFDAGLCHRSADFESRLDEAAPDGIDLYFDNIGGNLQSQIMERMRPNGRFLICGMISEYGESQPSPGPNLFVTVRRNFKIQGFLATYYRDKFSEFVSRAKDLLVRGKLSMREEAVEGLRQAPAALIGLLGGQNTGQCIVFEREHLDAASVSIRTKGITL